MGKDDKPVKGSNRENFNVLKSETYKQRVRKEESVLEEIEKKNFTTNKDRINTNNNYLAIQKKDPNYTSMQSKTFKVII